MTVPDEAPREYARLIGWADWLQEVTNDLIVVYSDREKWRWLRDTALDNVSIPHPHPFLHWVSRLYGNNVAMAVRRHVDRRRDQRGFRRLLGEIARSEIHRDTFLEYRLWLSRDSHFREARVLEMADRAFDSVAGPGAVRLREGCNQVDIDQLDAVSERVGNYATGRLAHLGEGADDLDVPTYGDLDNALEAFELIIQKYHSFLRDIHLRVTPVDNTDWKAAFAVPWFTNDGYVRNIKDRYPRT